MRSKSRKYVSYFMKRIESIRNIFDRFSETMGYRTRKSSPRVVSYPAKTSWTSSVRAWINSWKRMPIMMTLSASTVRTVSTERVTSSASECVQNQPSGDFRLNKYIKNFGLWAITEMHLFHTFLPKCFLDFVKVSECGIRKPSWRGWVALQAEEDSHHLICRWPAKPHTEEQVLDQFSLPFSLVGHARLYASICFLAARTDEQCFAGCTRWKTSKTAYSKIEPWREKNAKWCCAYELDFLDKEKLSRKTCSSVRGLIHSAGNKRRWNHFLRSSISRTNY